MPRQNQLRTPPACPRGDPSEHARQLAARSGGRSGSTSAQPDGISPAFLWRVFCQWWKWVVPLGVLLSVGAGVLVWCLHVPKYEATAMIMIESDAPYIAFEERDGEPATRIDSSKLKSSYCRVRSSWPPCSASPRSPRSLSCGESRPTKTPPAAPRGHASRQIRAVHRALPEPVGRRRSQRRE